MTRSVRSVQGPAAARSSILRRRMRRSCKSSGVLTGRVRAERRGSGRSGPSSMRYHCPCGRRLRSVSSAARESYPARRASAVEMRSGFTREIDPMSSLPAGVSKVPRSRTEGRRQRRNASVTLPLLIPSRTCFRNNMDLCGTRSLSSAIAGARVPQGYGNHASSRAGWPPML